MTDWIDEIELERYRKEGAVQVIPGGATTAKKIIRYSIKDDTPIIEEIYESILSAERKHPEVFEWGISKAIYHGFKDIRPAQNYYMGYYWDLLNNFNHKSLVEDYYKNPKVSENNFRDIDRRIVCCKLGTTYIVRIYDNCTHVVKSGFPKIDRPLNDPSKNYYKGYTWYRAEDFRQRYSKELEEYERRTKYKDNP